jgi:hypothetical protein
MNCRLFLLITIATFPLLSLLSAQENHKPTFVSKGSFSLLRGPRGHRGAQGPQGNPGTTSARIYASAYFQSVYSSASVLINTGAVPLNQVERASGVDTSQLISNYALVIKTAGQYLIQYIVNGSSTANIEIALFKNGIILPGSISRMTGISGANQTCTPVSNKVIVSLLPYDIIQIRCLNTTLTTPVVSLSMSPLTTNARLASLTIEKMD